MANVAEYTPPTSPGGSYPEESVGSASLIAQEDPSEASADPGAAPTKASVVFNLMNTVIGVGVLAMPFCFKKAGLILAPIVLVLVGLLTERSLTLMVKAGELCNTTDGYSQTVRWCFGPRAGKAVDVIILFMNFGAAVAYLDVIADILCAWGGLSMKVPLLLLVTVVLILPLSSMPQVTKLKFTSMLGIGVYGLFGVICVALFFSPPGDAGETNGTAPTGLNGDEPGGAGGRPDLADGGLTLFNSQVLVVVPIVSLSYACHTCVFPVYREYRTGFAVPSDAEEPFLGAMRMTLLGCLGM